MRFVRIPSAEQVCKFLLHSELHEIARQVGICEPLVEQLLREFVRHHAEPVATDVLDALMQVEHRLHAHGCGNREPFHDVAHERLPALFHADFPCEVVPNVLRNPERRVDDLVAALDEPLMIAG